MTYLAWLIVTNPGLFDAPPLKLLVIDFAVIGGLTALFLGVWK